MGLVTDIMDSDVAQMQRRQAEGGPAQRTGAAAAPGAMPPPGEEMPPEEEDDRTRPLDPYAEDEEEAPADQQDQYNRLMAGIMTIIFGDQEVQGSIEASDQVADQLQRLARQETVPEAVADMTMTILLQVDEKIPEGLPPKLIIAAAEETASHLADVAVGMNMLGPNADHERFLKQVGQALVLELQPALQISKQELEEMMAQVPPEAAERAYHEQAAAALPEGAQVPPPTPR